MPDILAAWRRRRPGWLRRSWARHPRLAMAVRAALAAGLAWYAGQAVPEPLGDYPYYAPMGAAVATSLTLAGSARESVQAVAGIALGAVIAVGVETVGGPDVWGVAAVVGIGVLVSGLRVLGSMGSWVITGALFALIFGHRDPEGFISAYAGLTALGAAIGVGVNFIFPTLPLAPAQEAMMRVRSTLVAQLSDLAGGLDQASPPDADEWAGRRRELEPLIATMRTAVRDAQEAGRANRRVHRYAQVLDYSIRQSRALETAAFLVEDLTDLLITEERAENDRVALGPELRPVAARALEALSVALGSISEAAADPEKHAAADAALEELVSEMQRVREHYPGDAFLAASSVAGSVRRCLEAVRPAPAD